MLETPKAALLAGGVAAGVLLALLFWDQIAPLAGLPAYLTRVLHIGGAAVWLGLIWFVNFIQLPLIAQAADADRAALVRLVVPRVAAAFRAAAHLTVVSGLVLVAFAPTAPLAAPRTIALVTSAALGLAMWAIVEFGIRPRVAILTGPPPAGPDDRAAAARGIRTLARVNLILSVPVTVLMIAAAHLH